ncbi:hypothetical protein [Methylotuvimicrobium buryatense]|uniref:hypothetical protein n=1 Tax=Methylotuvimicrobium buryatense TaxID=95641 RepID=UPI00034DC606|nr:hypothetical protein [Methylotuvimicrobium buryatense]
MMRQNENDRPGGEFAASAKRPIKTRLHRLKSRRKVWLDVHLWLGLALGFLPAIYGAVARMKRSAIREVRSRAIPVFRFAAYGLRPFIHTTDRR